MVTSHYPLVGTVCPLLPCRRDTLSLVPTTEFEWFPSPNAWAFGQEHKDGPLAKSVKTRSKSDRFGQPLGEGDGKRPFQRLHQTVCFPKLAFSWRQVGWANCHQWPARKQICLQRATLLTESRVRSLHWPKGARFQASLCSPCLVDILSHLRVTINVLLPKWCKRSFPSSTVECWLSLPWKSLYLVHSSELKMIRAGGREGGTEQRGFLGQWNYSVWFIMRDRCHYKVVQTHRIYSLLQTICVPPTFLCWDGTLNVRGQVEVGPYEVLAS